MQTILYLIRHGEVHNPDGILYGRLPNYRLSEKGRLEIEKTAEFLKDKHIDAIYSSPLARARQSAEIIEKKLHLPPIHIIDEISEVKTSYQGRKFSELDTFQSEVYLKPLDPSDETIEQLAHRMLIVIYALLKKHEGQHIAVVSHGDPIMALKASIKKTPLEIIPFKTDHYIQHAEVYEITIDNHNNLSIKNTFIPHV